MQALKQQTQQQIHRIDVGIGRHLRAVKIQLISPHEPCLDAQLNDVLEEAVKDLQPVSFADLAQTAVVWNRFSQVITDLPAMSQVEIDRLHQLPFRADPFKEAIFCSLKKITGSIDGRPISE